MKQILWSKLCKPWRLFLKWVSMFVAENFSPCKTKYKKYPFRHLPELILFFFKHDCEFGKILTFFHIRNVLWNLVTLKLWISVNVEVLWCDFSLPSPTCKFHYHIDSVPISVTDHFLWPLGNANYIVHPWVKSCEFILACSYICEFVH